MQFPFFLQFNLLNVKFTTHKGLHSTNYSLEVDMGPPNLKWQDITIFHIFNLRGIYLAWTATQLLLTHLVDISNYMASCYTISNLFGNESFWCSPNRFGPVRDLTLDRQNTGPSSKKV